MAQRHCATVHVHFAKVDPQLAGHGDRRHRERLVDLIEIHVFVLPASFVPQLPHGFDRRHHYPLRSNAAGGLRHNTAIGLSPSSLAFPADITTNAAAASFTPGALPAVTVPSFLNAGFSPRNASTVVSSRGPSSLVNHTGAASFFFDGSSTGTI